MRGYYAHHQSLQAYQCCPVGLGIPIEGTGLGGRGTGMPKPLPVPLYSAAFPRRWARVARMWGACMGEGGSHVGRLPGRVGGKRGRQRVACMWGRLHVRVAHVGVAHVGASLGRGLGLICKFKTKQFCSFSSSVSFIIAIL